MANPLVGPAGQLFAEKESGQDEIAFQIDNSSAAYYKSVYYTQHKNDLQQVPPPRVVLPRMDLADVLGPHRVAAITAARKIVFHAVGDTGAAKSTGPATEAAVADMMVEDVRAGGSKAPAFFFHLGDVVYHFGEGKHYYDQFYEPFRGYDRPIFAIPGNHDGMVFGDDPDKPRVKTLTAFKRNFCAKEPQRSSDSGTLVRTAMNQPGVFFTLDAPLVSIIGLYSNVLEGPGVISSQDGHYPIGDEQLAFLTAELTRLRAARLAMERAVVIAIHHPPLSIDQKHGGSTGASKDIDKACRAAKLWPDLVLSGHAHLYQRYTRRVGSAEFPYVVAGSGGFSKTTPHAIPPTPLTIGDHTLEIQPIVEFGYLTVTVDLSKSTKVIKSAFHSPAKGRWVDVVNLDLSKRRVIRDT